MNSSEFQDGNSNGNFGEIQFSRVTRLPVIILTRTVEAEKPTQKPRNSNQKNPHARNCSARKSGAGNGKY